MQPGDDFLLVSCADGAGPEAEEDARARRLSGSSDSARKSDGEKGQKDVEIVGNASRASFRFGACALEFVEDRVC